MCTQNSRYQSSLTGSIDECKAKQRALSIELQKGISLLTDQLEESRKQIRTANLIATSSHVEASSAGEFRRQLEVIANNIRATAGQIGTHLWVDSMERHAPKMRKFHQRWMPSNEAKLDRIRRGRRLDINIMAPQHGPLFKPPFVHEFLDWFEALPVGTAIRG
ncbi:hypothetical protein [Thalassolituus sp.]|uniref:hypothetical protein n=1 Tax=Thalassolituus sp. TaxID=2030822 RepID=UPI002A7F7150|nr:hypothetical protein [Thalassolituus sp.]